MEEYRKELMERYGDRLMEKYERSRHKSVAGFKEVLAEEKINEPEVAPEENILEEKEKKWDISLIMGILALIGLLIMIFLYPSI